MYLGVYNICRSKTHDNNNLKAEQGEMEACYQRVLYAKWNLSLEVKDVYYKPRSKRNQEL